MYSLYIVISVLFFVTPSIYGQAVSSIAFPSGSATYDKYVSWQNVLTTVDSSNQRVVHSSGGAAGGIVSEGQGYGVFLGASVAIGLGSSDSRYSTAISTAYQLFKGWKAMCKLSNTGSNNCQSTYMCPDTTVSPVVNYPCLPNWKFNDQLGPWEYGSATDGDIDGITGTALLAAATSSAKPTWWIEVAQWACGSIFQFMDNAVESDTVGGVAERVLKLGSCWGGLSCTNPSYFAPGHYRFLANFLGTYCPAFGYSSSKISTYQGYYNTLITSSYKIMLSNQNSAGLTTNWYIPNSSDLSKAGSVTGGCDSSGTPDDQYGAEAARGVWRACVDYAWFQSPSSKTYLDKVVNQLSKQFTGSGFNSLDTGGFVNSVFASWQSTAFIYGPTFCALIDNLALSNQAAALAKARDIVSGGAITEYYGGSWTVLSTLTLCGDLAKAASLVGGKPPGPQAPITPVTPPPVTPPTVTPPPVKPPVTPVAPVTPPPVTPPTVTTPPVKPPATPVAPVTPPPVTPVAPSAHTCTLKGCAINLYYAEFVTSTLTVKTAQIRCSDGRIVACSVSVSGNPGKYACSVTDSKSCLRPTPVLDGTDCPLSIPHTGQSLSAGSGNSPPWWIEFVPPTPSYLANLGSVLCADGRYQSCVDGTNKLNCQIQENACTNPVAIYDGSIYLLSGTTTIPATSSLVSDSSTDGFNTSSLPVWGIALIIVGIVVVVVLVITVSIIKRRRSASEIV